MKSRVAILTHHLKVNVQDVIIIIAVQTTNSSSSIIAMYIRGLLGGAGINLKLWKGVKLVI